MKRQYLSSIWALKQTSKEMWADAKTAFETAISELEKTYENAKTKFSS